ncbi:MAG: ABC transporter permease [Thermomicrobium sp.]|nr:ABC transporter permease [Thermomicrobium sp.]
MFVQYLIRRAIGGFAVVLLATFFVFVFIRIAGDPAALIVGGTGENITINPERVAQVRRELGLDRPLIVQFFDFLAGLVTGGLGNSFVTGRPIADELRVRLPLTIEIAFLSEFVAWIFALPLGLFSALRRGRFTEGLTRVFFFVASAIPAYWLGLLVLIFVLLTFGWRPPLGLVSPTQNLAVHLQQIILPIVVLGFVLAAGLVRFIRNAVLEVLQEPFIQVARAKGLAESTVVFRHVLRNAFAPTLAFSGLRVGFLLGGVVIVETTFNLPGLGLFFVEAVARRDFPVIQIAVLILGTAFVVINLLTDIACSLLDPRLRERG